MEMKYGRVIVEGKEIPEGEPLFLLRGQDALAADAVDYYATLREQHGDYTGASACREAATRMRAWPVKKLPD